MPALEDVIDPSDDQDAAKHGGRPVPRGNQVISLGNL